MVPGILGVLTRATVALTAALGVALTTWLTRRDAKPPPDARVSPRAGWRSLAPAGLAGAAIAICLAGYYRTEAVRSVTSDDMLNFHLPLVARWIQSGSFWPVVDLLAYDTTGNYPQNGDVLMLAAVLPWRADAFARLAALPYIGVAGLATYALGIELRADRAKAALMGCVVVATPILLRAGVVSALPDVVMYGTFGAGLVFLLRCARSRLASDALLAGLALGVAFGTKWYAVPAVLAMLVLFAVGLLVERFGRLAVARLVGIAAGGVLVAGGFWLLRNAVESGSPFFPAGWLPVGARSDVGNPAPRTDYPLAHYLFNAHVWRHVVLPDELRAFGLGGILLLAGALGAAALAGVAARRKEAEARPVLWTLAAAGLLAVVYVATPNTASGFDGKPVLVYYSARYLVPAAIPAAAAIAWGATRLERRWALTGSIAGLLALVAVADGLRRAFDIPAGRLALGALAIAALAAAVLGARRIARSPRRRSGSMAIAAAVAGIVVIAAAGYAVQHRYEAKRLRGEDSAVDYFLAHSVEGDRVGLAEQWSVLPPSPVLAMFGARFRNRVDYLGVQSEGVNKPYRDRAAFLARVGGGRYDWLMIGRGSPPVAVTPAMSLAAAAGYRLVAQTGRLALYRSTASRVHPAVDVPGP
jgi:hypothetical protein